eukprot:CAMPEP_0117458124 /NCGR_PEP_ID=MMETSP0784-20121206/766_1 /TAXON_ID=39447 /ORGANISM="" /LENGTH=1084 /DNA_ID=CAMNT_0005251627 /DNA_START=143 /DNA_END=3395 /DNA_ORIENTATION=-
MGAQRASHDSRNQEECQVTRERRIALFTARVEDVEAQWQGVMSGHCQIAFDPQRCGGGSRKPSAPKIDPCSLTPISVSELSVGKVHKGRVLYCGTVTRCMLLSHSVSTLVEDSCGQLASLQVYSAPRVTNIWEAQAWLPEGTSLAIVEPFFKLRADGTPGIRVDDPRELVRDAAPPSGVAALAGSTQGNGSLVAVEERLRQLSADASFGYKRIHKQLIEEGHTISQNKVREQVAKLRKNRPAELADGSTAGQGASAAAGADPTPSAGGGSGPSISSAASPSAGGKVEGVLPLQAHVRVEGLQSEAGKALNGCEGSVAGHDFAAGRVVVVIAGVGQKSIGKGNLRVLSTPSAPLPLPAGQWPTLNELCVQSRWLEALVLGQCEDNAFLSHTMCAFHPRIWQTAQELTECGGEGEAVFRLVVSLVKAYREAQAMDPSADLQDIQNASSILTLADETVASSKGDNLVVRVSALFFRGILSRSMHDWSSSAADFRAAYAASEGHQPWILLRAGWCIASCTDGVPREVLLQNYADGQVMYEMLLHHVDRIADEGNPSEELRVARVFCLWELAQVLLWRHGWMNPVTAHIVAKAVGVPLGPGDTDGPAAEALMKQVFSLKERALNAESAMASPGIMNSLARDAVLHRTALLGGKVGQNDAQQVPVTSKSQQSGPKDVEAASAFPLAAGPQASAPAHCSDSAFSSFHQMQAKEVSRMEKEERALCDGDLVSLLLGHSISFARHAAGFERGARERRTALEAKAEALAAHETAFQRREAEQAEQRARWQQEAERMRGDSAALEELYRQEQQRQAKDFAAETARLREQHLAEVAEVRQQFDAVVRQSEREVQAAIETQRQLELALKEAVGAKETEAERWQRELCAKEQQVVFEQDSLAAQAAQLAEMQEELDEKRKLLEEKDCQLRQERQAKEQLLAGEPLSKEFFGTQRSGHHCISLHKLKYSQNSIKATFRDGKSVEKTIQDLRQGKLRPADLPRIRVVELPKLGQIWSLDNRRLRCLKAAFAGSRNMTIDVEVVPLSDPAVLAEFRRKWTAGEQIQVRDATADQSAKRAGEEIQEHGATAEPTQLAPHSSC